MNRKYLFLFLILFVVFSGTINPVFSQKQKIYMDQSWKKVNTESMATYYRIIEPLGIKKYKVNDFYISGELQMEGFYADVECEIKNGKFTLYYRTGQKKSEGSYVYGKQDGTWTYWYENGNLESIQNYNHRKFKEYTDPQTGEHIINDGKVHTWKYYSRKGELFKEVHYKKGNESDEKYFNYQADPNYWKEPKLYDSGKLESLREKIGYRYYGSYIDYYPDGTICRKAWFENNYLKGDYFVYYPDGKIKIKGKFDSHIPSAQTSLVEDLIIGSIRKSIVLDFYQGRSGEWVYYDNKGNIVRKEFYKSGKLIDSKTIDIDNVYFKNGSIKISIEKRGGYFNGKYADFYENGKLKREMQFQYDTLAGNYKEYFENGNIKIEGKFDAKDISVYQPVSEDIQSDIYSNETFIDINSGRSGKWLFYDENGTLIKKESYKKSGK